MLTSRTNLRPPLTAIQGFTETLLGGAIDDSRNNRRFLEVIRDHAVRLARLTDDLLKLARIEAGKLEVQFFPVGLVDLIEGCAETTLFKAARKQIALEIDLPPGLPAVRGDASLLRDVLQNLLDNAIQYTPEGGLIRVNATVGARELVVTVTDTGIGIPLAEQERIFERFYRVDPARSREAGGTGLGLSIAKHIVEAHGGRLSGRKRSRPRLEVFILNSTCSNLALHVFEGADSHSLHLLATHPVHAARVKKDSSVIGDERCNERGRHHGNAGNFRRHVSGCARKLSNFSGPHG